MSVTDSPLPTAASHNQASKPDTGVTTRVVIFSLFLALVLGYLIPVIDFKFSNTFLGASHLPPGAIGALLVLVLVVNPVLGLLSRGLRFTRNEALTVYITCLFSCLVPGHGSENFIVPNLLAPFYFANTNNKWMEFLPSLKPWLTPALNADGSVNTVLVEGWFLGGPVPWSAWLVPMGFWVTLIFASYAMLGCLSALLRAQWVEREALSFPLLRLPLQMTEDMDARRGGERFYGNALMWAGFGVAVLIQMMRGLNVYFADFPTFPLHLDTGPLLREAPWNQIGWVPLFIFPVVVGVAFLLTAEVSFSLWFFYWFIKLQAIGLYHMGYPAGTLPGAGGALPGKAITGYQMAGCYLMFVALVLWTGREHFRYVLARALGKRAASEEEKHEVMSYPLAFWGFVGSFLMVTGLTCLAGVRLDLAMVLWVGYLVFAIALTRVAAEGGMLMLINDAAPLGIIGRLLGSSPNVWLSTQAGLVPAAFVQAGFAVHMRAFILPSFMHAWKLAHDRGISARRLGLLVAAVILVSSTMGLQMAIRLGYENGGLSLGHKWWATVGPLWPGNFVNAMTNTQDNSWLVNWAAMTFGAGFTWGMMLFRSRFAGFLLHPIGYLMAHTYPVAMFWFSIFLGWGAKTLVMRFGGTDAYRRATYGFLGLALGDVSMMLFWLAIDGWQGRAGHMLMPG